MTSEHLHRCWNNAECHDENHLCRIILKRDLGRIKELVKDAQYYCKNCGRAARESGNLCDPSKI